MQEDLVDRYLDGEGGAQRLSGRRRRHRVEVGGLAQDAGAAVDAEDLLAARDEVEEPDVRVAQDVVEAVAPAVPGAFGEGDRRGVDDVREAGEVAARRGVAVAVLVRGGQDAEGGTGEDVEVLGSEAVVDLLDHDGPGLAEERGQLLGVADLGGGDRDGGTGLGAGGGGRGRRGGGGAFVAGERGH
ncbi:hypothetical protein STTU_3459 [Streptomyces sp. Tu6071]|nr:hypothetical protein STTU_3459 [Streptomyces sp. Tu6071]